MNATPEKWSDFQRPEWIPVEAWGWIVDFWRESYGRGPKAWLRSHEIQRAPDTGTVVGVAELSDPRNGNWGIVCSAMDPRAEKVGRYLHCWNNIGRVITEDGELLFVWHTGDMRRIAELPAATN